MYSLDLMVPPGNLSAAREKRRNRLDLLRCLALAFPKHHRATTIDVRPDRFLERCMKALKRQKGRAEGGRAHNEAPPCAHAQRGAEPRFGRKKRKYVRNHLVGELADAAAGAVSSNTIDGR